MWLQVVKIVGKVSPARQKLGGNLTYCPVGDRHGGGVTLIQALIRNLGTCRADVKGKNQVEGLHKMQSTEAAHRGGSACSREERIVMILDRRGTVVQTDLHRQLKRGGFV